VLNKITLGQRREKKQRRRKIRVREELPAKRRKAETWMPGKKETEYVYTRTFLRGVAGASISTYLFTRFKRERERERDAYTHTHTPSIGARKQHSGETTFAANGYTEIQTSRRIRMFTLVSTSPFFFLPTRRVNSVARESSRLRESSWPLLISSSRADRLLFYFTLL